MNRIIDAFSPGNHFKRFCALLGIFIMARGILYLCILPPFEGWDEYQHVAYIQYLIEENKQPVIDQAKVSRKLLARISTYPQPRYMVKQTVATGARDYTSFFNSSSEISYNSNHPDIPLYQAQHGSLYYQFMRPLFALSGGINDLDQSISALRLMNLVFAVFALIACFWFIHRVTEDSVRAALLMIVLACQPLYLINACRVANDALAVALGTVVIIMALEKDWYNRKLLIVLIGIFLGLAIWAKMTNLPLGLFVLLTLIYGWLKKTIVLKRAMGVGCGVVLLSIITSSPNLIFNLRQYDAVAPMKEVMLNQTKDKSISEVAIAISELNIVKKLREVWIRYSTWTGGWSYLSVKLAEQLAKYLLSLALAGWILHLFRCLRRPLLFPIDSLIKFMVLVFCINAAFAWKMIQSHLAWGIAGINAWYACVGLPFFLFLAFEGAGRWNRQGATLFGWLMIVTYLFAEIYGALTQMLPAYSGGANGMEAVRRIADLHPGWLGPETIIISGILFIALFMMITLSWLMEAGLLSRRWNKA